MKFTSGKLTQVLEESISDSFDSSQVDGSIETPCALSIEKKCCDGRGFNLSMVGSKTVANICDCVRQCATCLGHAQKVDGAGTSYSCIKNPPTKTVNLINAADIPARYKDASLKGFSNHSGNGAKVVSEIQDWIHQFVVEQEYGLILGGPVGVGKTFLLAAIAKALISKGISVKFVDFFQLISEIKAGFSSGKSEAAIIRPLLAVDVLVIDEMGKGRNTEFELTVLDQVVMGRYNARKMLVASTNCSFEVTAPTYASNVPLDHESNPRGSFASDNFGTLEDRVGKRVFSRLIETTRVLELNGEDFRRRPMR